MKKEATGTTVPQTQPQHEPSLSEKFTGMVMKEFQALTPGGKLTDFQKRLCQNYFVKLDQVLKAAEIKRLAKSEQYRDALPLTWKNVNLPKLALDVVSFSSVGLDPLQPNHLNLIPYKNNSTNLYDIGFIIGYRGCEVKARKYGLDVPDDVIVELVYQNDKFKQIKKDINNDVESYVFEVVDDFNRGPLVGGFYYFSYSDPRKNKIKVFTRADIEKRKPAYASAEFWGGEKDKWENGKKAGKETLEGWYDEMAYKTVFRAAYNSITIDSRKIDDAYQAILQKDIELKDEVVAREILANANKTELGFEDAELVPQATIAAPVQQPIQVQQQPAQSAQPQPQSQNQPNF